MGIPLFPQRHRLIAYLIRADVDFHPFFINANVNASANAMALFVDLDEESEPPQARGYHRPCGVTPEWNGGQTKELPTAPSSEVSPATLSNQNGSLTWSVDPAQQPQPAREISNQNAMTEALGCYP